MEADDRKLGKKENIIKNPIENKAQKYIDDLTRENEALRAAANEYKKTLSPTKVLQKVLRESSELSRVKITNWLEKIK